MTKSNSLSILSSISSIAARVSVDEQGHEDQPREIAVDVRDERSICSSLGAVLAGYSGCGRNESKRELPRSTSGARLTGDAAGRPYSWPQDHTPGCWKALSALRRAMTTIWPQPSRHRTGEESHAAGVRLVMFKFVPVVAAAPLASGVAAPAAAALGPDASACSEGRPSVLVNVIGFKRRTGNIRVAALRQRSGQLPRQWRDAAQDQPAGDAGRADADLHRRARIPAAMRSRSATTSMATMPAATGATAAASRATRTSRCFICGRASTTSRSMSATACIGGERRPPLSLRPLHPPGAAADMAPVALLSNPRSTGNRPLLPRSPRLLRPAQGHLPL